MDKNTPAATEELSQIGNGATRKECSRTLFSNSVASLPNIENIVTIPISTGKYIVTCEFSQTPHAEDMDRIRRLAVNLDRWWNSNNKFFVLTQGDNIPTIRFEKLEDDTEDDANEL